MEAGAAEPGDGRGGNPAEGGAKNSLGDGGESMMMEMPSFGAEVPPVDKPVAGALQPEQRDASALRYHANAAVQAFDMQRQAGLTRIRTSSASAAGSWREGVADSERKDQVSILYQLLKTRYPNELDNQVKERLVGIARRVEGGWFERATSKEEYLNQQALRQNFQSLTAALKRPREESTDLQNQVMVQQQAPRLAGNLQHAPIQRQAIDQYGQGVPVLVNAQGPQASGMRHNTVYSSMNGHMDGPSAGMGPIQHGYSAGIEGPILMRSSTRNVTNGQGVAPSSLGIAGSNGVQMYPQQMYPQQMYPQQMYPQQIDQNHGMIGTNQLTSSRLRQMIPVEQSVGARQGETSSGIPSHSGTELDGIIPVNQIAGQGTDPAVNEERRNQILKQQRWLLFLRHCAKCTAGPNQCQYKSTCALAKELWRHLIDCKDDKCKYPRCGPSRILLQHHQKCRDKTCPVCMPVKQYVSKQRESLRNKGLTDEQRMRSQATSDYQQPVLDLASRARREEREKELLSNEKNMGTSLVEYFSIEEIEEHMKLLRLSDAVTKPPGVPGRKPAARAESFDGVLSHEIVEESLCQLCAHSRLVFEPPAIYCYSCGVKVKRNQVFYTSPPSSETKGQWCTTCISSAADELMLDSFTVAKRDLVKKKNNDQSEEPWVQCDICELWVHQICGLFNKGRNDAERGFVCPACLKGALESGKRHVPETRPQAMLTAKDLPKCRLSDVLEERLERGMRAEKEARAKNAGTTVDQVEEYPELCIRVVNNVEKKVEVTPLFAKEFCKGTGRADAYLYTQKVVLLFQKINGVDICLYCLYVQEYGDNCPAPNNRVVYLSYLDSVKYFCPDGVGAAGMDMAMRTFVYHEVLMGYIADVKMRGFCAMYIWACPPLAGDDYIFFCHPNKQKVPRSDRLREWYLSMLKRCQEEGIVTYVSNLFDTFFNGGKDHRVSRPSVTDLPYLAGDYWPGEAEKHLAVKEELAAPAGGTSRTNKKKEKRILLPDGAGPGEIVLAKLAEYSDMQKMKADFIVAHLYESCSHCRVYVSGDKLYRHPKPPTNVTIKAERSFDGIALDKPGEPSREFSISRFQLCSNCYDREGGKLDDKPLGLPSGIKLEDLVAEDCPVIPANSDDDPDMDSEFFDTRQQYLSLCQGNHYQFDTLRRARHSSMMSLYHLHNPSEPAFTATCNHCQREVQPGESYRCTKCPDFDMCGTCFRKSQLDHRLAHPHPLTAPSGRKFDETQMRLSREDKKKRMQQMRALMHLVLHAASCQGCENPNCARVKNMYQHLETCPNGPQGGCANCKKIYVYISMHSKLCTTSDCPVPHCSRIRSIRREHAARQEAARAAAYREMMVRQGQP